MTARMMANDIIELLDERKRLHAAYQLADCNDYNQYGWVDRLKAALGIKPPSRHEGSRQIEAVLMECRPAIIFAIKADLRLKMAGIDGQLIAAGVAVQPEFLATQANGVSGSS